MMIIALLGALLSAAALWLLLVSSPKSTADEEFGVKVLFDEPDASVE